MLPVKAFLDSWLLKHPTGPRQLDRSEPNYQLIQHPFNRAKRLPIRPTEIPLSWRWLAALILPTLDSFERQEPRSFSTVHLIGSMKPNWQRKNIDHTKNIKYKIVPGWNFTLGKPSYIFRSLNKISPCYSTLKMQMLSRRYLGQTSWTAGHSGGAVHQSERNSLFWEIEHIGASAKLTSVVKMEFSTAILSSV